MAGGGAGSVTSRGGAPAAGKANDPNAQWNVFRHIPQCHICRSNRSTRHGTPVIHVGPICNQGTGLCSGTRTC